MFLQKAPSLPTENAAECRTTAYGCCYDRTTPASGPNGEGCPNPPNHSKRMADDAKCHRHKDDIWLVPSRQLSALFAPCLAPLAPAALGCPATTTTSSPPSACTSGLAVVMATATTLWAWKSVRGHVRFLSQANRTQVQPIRPEKPTAPTGPHLRLLGLRAEALETWGGSSQSTEPPAAAPADRPRALPRRLTEEDSGCVIAGLSLLARHSIAAPQRGKNLTKARSVSQPHLQRLCRADRLPAEKQE